MSQRKMTLNRTLSKAVTRHASIISIDKDMDLGNGITNGDYELAIESLRTSIDEYNTTLSMVDEKRNIIREQEGVVKDLSERILSGIGSKYGKNSNEYNKAGGKKKTGIKHHKRVPVKKAG